MILNEIEKHGLDINYLRAQCYDGASNMSGKFSGVQARIRQVAPLANYIHCKAHSLNLALVHSSNIPAVRTMMGTVQDIAFAFDYSAKRLEAYYNALERDQNTKESMDGRTKLRTLCETRWSSRADALYTFKTSFPVVVQALEVLHDDNDEKAGLHLAGILRFEFIVALVAAEHILSGTVALTNYLQAVDCDLLEAISESKVVMSRLRSERGDDMVWDVLYDTAVDMARQVDIEPRIPRRVGRKQHRANHPAGNPSDYWKVSVYYPFMDHLLQEMDKRLIQNEPRYIAQYLLPAKIGMLTDDMVNSLYDTYGADITGSHDAYLEEIGRWRTKWSDDTTHKPSRLLETLPRANCILYPSIRTILLVMLTMPTTSATAERPFSVMRRVKNYLRSTMTDNRLSGLAVLHSHRDIDVSVEAIVNKFAAEKRRRLDFV